jgi:bis(5'-nucleosyl)-tetraphosphatase (symmetrical)
MYLIGDIQGCDEPLGRLLHTIDFSPSRDTLFVLGDLVNRGPESLRVLRRLMSYGTSARCLLGNHDLHLLALTHGARKPGAKDTLTELLQAPDCSTLLAWLQGLPLAMHTLLGDKELLMVHAGVLPPWDAPTTLRLAREVQAQLQSADSGAFFHAMYGNAPNRWSSDLVGAERLRVIVNALTRLRFCTPEGVMEFTSTEGAGAAPAGYVPWFEVPGRCTGNVTVAFGHWSTLGYMDRANLLALDTGCVWGGCLSAVRISSTQQEPSFQRELIQVKCPQAQKPG